MKQKEKRERLIALAALSIGLVLTLLISSAVSFAETCAPIRSEVLRLHILANSDSDQDQKLKLAVRDRILKLDLFSSESTSSKEETEQEAAAALSEIEAAAREELRIQGCSGDVKAELVRMYFTTRVYENVTLPAGYYDAVRITIGKGAGHNWWCVLYPPLCIPAAEAEQPLDVFTPEEEEIITGQEEYEIRFFVVELYESICNFLFGEEENAIAPE